MIPQHWFRKLFPTARRLLVERDLRHKTNIICTRTLVVGAGYDPYRCLVDTVEYVRLDIKTYPECTDVVGDALKLPFREDCFDAVLSIEVLEHVENTKLFVNELYDVLVPGGKVFLTVPFMFHQHGDPQDFWRPTRHALEVLFSNFRKVDIHAQGGRLCVMSDLLTTSYSVPVFFPLRVFNHIIVRFQRGSNTTAPSGFLVIATK